MEIIPEKKVYIVEMDDGRQKVRISPHLMISEFEQQVFTQLQLPVEKNVATNRHEIWVFNKVSNEYLPFHSLGQLKNSNHRLRVASRLEKTAMLSLPWKQYAYDFALGEFKIRQEPIFIDQTQNAGLGTGLTIWDGSVVLSKYLEQKPYLVQEQTVLELGAGTGVVGVTAGKLHAKRVVVTDLKYTHENLWRNIRRNHLEGIIDVLELDWTRLPKRLDAHFDLIVASDVVWIESLIEPLVQTFDFCLKQFPDTPILLAHQTRSESADRLFESSLADHSLVLSPIDDAIVRAEKVKLYRIVSGWTKT